MSDSTARGKEVFLSLIELPLAERGPRLEELSADDPELRAEVQALLEAHEAAGEFLERPPFLSEARTDAAGPASGERVGPYRLRRVLGEGGMGIVYLAEQEEPLRRTVALKVLKPGMDTRRVIARFEAERQALALMSHPGIARVHDAGATDRGRPFFVMEYVEGRPLVEHCDERRLSVRERIELFLEVCEAVGHAHRKGILHRDLKPSNVLVGEQDARFSPKVIDFGIAKAMGESPGGGADLTLAGTVIGTPEYMSPEQAEQAVAAIDTRSDIYSLGAVLYELLTGALPLDVGDALPRGFTAVRERIAREAPPRASLCVAAGGERAGRAAALRGTTAAALAAALRGDLDWILARTLEKEPERRYASVSELAADLERHLADEPVLAGPPTGIYRLRKYVARHRATVAALSAVLLTLAVGLGLSLWSLLRAWRAEDGLLRLSDRALLERYLEEAEELPFATPEDAAELERLEGDLLAILEHLPYLRERLALLRERAAVAPDGGWAFEEFEDSWHHELLADLVAALEALESEDPAASALARLRVRRDQARDSAASTVERHAAEWRRAIRSISNAKYAPVYGGLVLAPQVGLVPLERDPASGLWEFWHPLTGDRPARGEDGRWLMGEETGLVLVLIPAGSFRMGCRRPLEGDDPDEPNVDPFGQVDEQPVHRVEIGEPYFLSRYEMTQGQWLRAAWENPSQYQDRGLDLDVPTDLRHPVERVRRDQALALLGRMGLGLPTEAQWEYAARAGGSRVFGLSDDPLDLRHCANLRDIAATRTDMQTAQGGSAVPWDDGWPAHAPVGLLEPNAFGLHDVLGNVWEWTREPQGSYGAPTNPADGRRLDPQGRGALARGGSAWVLPASARVATRVWTGREQATGEVGIRPMRRVQR